MKIFFYLFLLQKIFGFARVIKRRPMVFSRITFKFDRNLEGDGKGEGDGKEVTTDNPVVENQDGKDGE